MPTNINMWKSKSSASFERRSEDADRKPLGRPKARSSLDTFLIPGRTRLPSSRVPVPEPVDLQITQGLLNPDSFKVSRKSLYQSEKATTGPNSEPFEKLPSYEEAPTAGRKMDDRALSILPPSRLLQGAVSGHRDFRDEDRVTEDPFADTEHHVAPLFHPRMASQTSEPQLHSLDGQFDSGHGSQVTSATWSTISHRIFTDSSGSSYARNQVEHVDEYNRLALKHGLPQFTEATERSRNTDAVQTDAYVTSKSQHNWLMRKILRRSTSTYSVKVKSHTKALPRKMSVSSISSVHDRGRKDFLRNKSLEEIVRLSGLSILLLPREFAADKLALPTCISATATYLSQHGRATPGIFRVPGQLSTVNALYDYYAHQFTSADSMPGHVQRTVGSGLLPTHIAHTIHDIASLFKKLVSSMPGGLLGSLSLFKAFRGIADNLHPNSVLPDSRQAKVRARLIALAISSVTSACRVSLICAVLGLAALIGHEAGKEGAKCRKEDEPTPSELMGYQALGLVLGPLLLGDLTDYLDVDTDNERGGLLAIPESPTKRPREKRVKPIGKLDQSPNMATYVDRARITARVMEMLISNWQDVVGQLRNINAPRSLICPRGRGHRLTSEHSRLTMRSSEEELLFEFLRGRPLPEEFNGSMKITKKVRISSRSPSLYKDIRASEHSGSGTWHSKSSVTNSGKGPFQEEPVHESGQEFLRHPYREATEHNYQDQEEPVTDAKKISSVTSSADSGATVVEELKDILYEDSKTLGGLYSDPRDLLNLIGQDSVTTPLSASTNSSPSRQPLKEPDSSRTHIRSPNSFDDSSPKRGPELAGHVERPPNMNSTLTSHKDGNLTSASISTTHPSHAQLGSTSLPDPTLSIPPTNPPTVQNFTRNEGPIPFPLPSRQTSVKALAQHFSQPQTSNKPHPPTTKTKILSDSYLRIRSLLSSSGSSSGTTRGCSSPQKVTPPAQIPLPESTPSSPGPSPGKESLIPRPVNDRGRARTALSRSPSPVKSRNLNLDLVLPPDDARLGKGKGSGPAGCDVLLPAEDRELRGSVPEKEVGVVTGDRGLQILARKKRQAVVVGSGEEDVKVGEGSPRPRGVKTTASLPLLLLASGVDADVDVDVDLPPQRTPLTRKALSALSAESGFGLNTNANVNANVNVNIKNVATLFKEVRRLQRLYEAKCEEVVALGRSLEALRVWRGGGVACGGRDGCGGEDWEDGGGDWEAGGEGAERGGEAVAEAIRVESGNSLVRRVHSTAPGGCLSQSQTVSVSVSVREMRRERNMWRNRAVWAEGRLLGGGLGGGVVEEGGKRGGGLVEGEGKG